MKKTISLLLICVLILTLTSCYQEKKEYVSYMAIDNEYLMLNGVKYIPFEMPDDAPVTMIAFAYYRAAKEDVALEEDAFRSWWEKAIDPLFYVEVIDVLLPKNVVIKYCRNYGTFCLEKDKEYVDELFSHFSWDNVVGIQSNLQSFVTAPVFFSDALTEYFFNWLDRLEDWEDYVEHNLKPEDADNFYIWVYVDPDERKDLKGSPHIYIYDTNVVFRKSITGFIATDDGIYLRPDILAITSDPEKADYTLSEINNLINLKVPDELADVFYDFVYDD